MADLSANNAGSKPEPKGVPDTPPDSSSLRSWVVPITTAAILASVFCLYYFVYVRARREYLVNRNFRSLAALGDHIQREVSTHGSILEFYSDLAAARKHAKHDREKEKLEKFVLVRPEDQGLKPQARDLESRKDYLKYLAPQMDLSEVPIVVNGQTSPAPSRLDVQRHDGRWHLVLSAFRDRGADTDYIGSLEIADLLKVTPGSLPFDDILLISDSGTVVYEDKKAGPQFTTLSSLLKARTGVTESKPGGTEKEGGGTSGGGQKQEPAWRAASIHLTDVLLAGTSYKLFLQPILIDIFTDESTRTEPAREWVLCGLRSASALEWEALSISYTVIIAFTALFFAICMGGPVLKVIFMNRRERFRLRELGFLSLFVVLLAGVFTLTGLELVDVRAASDTDAQLQRLAETLSNNVSNDLRQMRAQLMAWCATDELHDDLKTAESTEVIRNTQEPQALNRWVKQTPKAGIFPFLNNAFWTDDDGHQIVKWSTGGYVTPMIDVSGLAVYNTPRWTYLDGVGPQFSLGSILPPNKLEYLAAFAISTSECSPKLSGVRGDIKAGTAFATGQPFSLVDPILPFGYGFAMVDDTGRVVFHTDKTKDGQENFREESEWNRDLYAATFGHANPRSLSINYLGKDYRARVVPVKGVTQAPWSLIVYADMAEERTLALQTMTMASSLLLLILAPPALVIVIWCLWRRPRFAPAWLWPNQHRMGTYLYQIAVYTVLIAVFLFVGFHGPAEQIVVACAAIPYTALLLTFWCFRRYPSRSETFRDQNAPRSVVVPTVLTVVTVAEFLLLLVFHWSHLKGLAVVAAVAAIAAIPLLNWPRRYVAVLMRHRRRRQAAGARVGVSTWPYLTHDNFYAVSVMLLLFLIGVLTPMALFRGCLAVESRLEVKEAQLHLASALMERRAYIHEKCEDLEMGPAACEQFNSKDSGVWEKIVPDSSLVAGHPPALVPHARPATGELYEVWFQNLIYLLHHEYNTAAAETLGVIQDRATGDTGRNAPDWSWVNGASTVTLRWHGVHSPAEKELAENDLLITSDVPVTHRSGAESGVWIAFGVMLVMGGVLWTLVRKVFLIHLAPLKMTGVREVAECIRTGQNVLILVPPSAGFDVEAPARVLDLKSIAVESRWAETVDLETPPLNGVVEICHFEYASDVATLDQKMILLQRLMQAENTQIAAIMEVPASSEDYRRMFPQLTVVDLREEPFLWLRQYEGPAQDLIWQECRPMAALWPLGAQLAKEIRSETNISNDTIASEILERADPYYRLVWKECSNEQKFVLSQLAEDGMMNPMNGRAIRQLIRRGFIVQDPAFQIMNESFRRFLGSVTTVEMKQQWLQESRRSGWGKVHGAFFTTMVVLGIFLLTTQNALWQSSAAYVTTAFGALGTLAKLFNTYRGTATGEKAN